MPVLMPAAAFPVRRHAGGSRDARHVQPGGIRRRDTDRARTGREGRHHAPDRRLALPAPDQGRLRYTLDIFFAPGAGRLLETFIGEVFVNGHSDNADRGMGAMNGRRGGLFRSRRSRNNRLIGDFKLHRPHLIGRVKRLLPQRCDKQLHKIIALRPIPAGRLF